MSNRPIVMRSRLRSILIPFLLTTACEAQPQASPFPEPQRPVAPIVSSRYSNEDARDSMDEANIVMRLADI